jgi:hypothetical protein
VVRLLVGPFESVGALPSWVRLVGDFSSLMSRCGYARRRTPLAGNLTEATVRRFGCANIKVRMWVIRHLFKQEQPATTKCCYLHHSSTGDNKSQKDGERAE